MHTHKLAVRLVLVLAALALSACAAQDARYAAGKQHARSGMFDYEKMARINNAARSKGVEVVWVNPPYRDGID